MNKLGKNKWTIIILFGLIGQIAWAIENTEFNLFLFNYVGGSAKDIADMVASSSIVATITTLLMGTISDRLGHRGLFLSIGYIMWGISTMAFAFISRENVARFVETERVLPVTVMLVIVMDCIMTFFGSTANDASFNSWVTETTDVTNRPKVEGVLNIFPLLSMLIVAGAAGIIIDMTSWPVFFLGTGIIVILCGILGLFIIKDEKNEAGKDKKGFFETLLYGFRSDVIKENSKFYLTLLCLCIFNIAVNTFMPYLLIYLEKTLGYSVMTYSIVMALVIIVASIISVLFSSRIDGIGRGKVLYIAVGMFALGLALVYFISSPWIFTAVGSFMMTGYVLISIILSANIRDYTPRDHVGMFQGIRIIAFVLVPMLIGPYIGSFLTDAISSGTYINSYNEIVNLPVKEIFVAAALVSLLIYIPARKVFKKNA